MPTMFGQHPLPRSWVRLSCSHTERTITLLCQPWRSIYCTKSYICHIRTITYPC